MHVDPVSIHRQFSLDSGARVVERIAADPTIDRGRDDQMLDLVIIGAGVSGMAAAVEARARGLRFEVLEAAARFFTLVNFPRGKPICTYPREMKPAGALQVSANNKEALIHELVSQTDQAGIAVTTARARRVSRDGGGLRVEVDDGPARRARHVVIAIGRSGDYRRIGVPGDDLPKVFHRLHDPADFRGARVLVVGGGDSAVETAIALTTAERLEHDAPAGQQTATAAGAPRTRPAATAIRAVPTPGPGTVAVRLESVVREIRAQEVVLRGPDGDSVIDNDIVFSMTGRETPLDLFRRSGVPIAGSMTTARWFAVAAFMVICTWLYNWKSGGFFSNLWYCNHWFPTNLPDLLAYFWYSGRFWCRFLCPLAALMHIYARFSSFRILADKKKCISCGQCTLMCHQGIDVMNFANKGVPMADPECVRCSACVHTCPTGVLSFGRVNGAGQLIASTR